MATAVGAYAANCGLGTATALRLVDTRGFRWVHHALYVGTATATTAATVASVRAGSATAVALVPALAPLALIPYLGRHGRRHVVLAASAAPWYAAALLILTLRKG